MGRIGKMSEGEGEIQAPVMEWMSHGMKGTTEGV